MQFDSLNDLLIRITKLKNKYETPNQYKGIAYIAKRLPTKKLIKRKIKAGSIAVEAFKFKNINVVRPKIPKIIISSLFSPKTNFEYSENFNFCSSVIVLKVSGKIKLIFGTSLGEKVKYTETKLIILPKLSKTKKGPLNSEKRLFELLKS